MTKKEPSEWNKTVTRVYNQNKHKPGYTFGKAMHDAKEVYHKKGGDASSVSDEDVSGSPDIVEKETVEVEEEQPEMSGGRRRRRRTHRRSSRRSRSTARCGRSRSSARACGRSRSRRRSG